MVKVTPSKKAETGTMRRLGFMAGECAVPDAFDQMGGDKIARLFGVKYGLGYEKYERVLRTSITFRRAPFDGHCGMKMLRTARQCLTYVSDESKYISMAHKRRADSDGANIKPAIMRGVPTVLLFKKCIH